MDRTLEQYHDRVGFEVPSLGIYEFQLAAHKVVEANPTLEGNIEAQLKAAVMDTRKQHGGNANYLSADAWQKVYAAAEAAARHELLDGNSLLAEVDELERTAREASEKARAKTAELNARLSEARGLPARIEALQDKLAAIEDQRTYLDKESLEQQFKSAYANWVLTNNVAHASELMESANQISAVLATRDLRLSVLKQAERDVKHDLDALLARKSELDKLLKR
jgi:small-conductance mechanosensitive channel